VQARSLVHTPHLQRKEAGVLRTGVNGACGPLFSVGDKGKGGVHSFEPVCFKSSDISEWYGGPSVTLPAPHRAKPGELLNLNTLKFAAAARSFKHAKIYSRRYVQLRAWLKKMLTLEDLT
jgi:hypothetical protein